jgi:N-acetylmuramoyl-L-alanine amidase
VFILFLSAIKPVFADNHDHTFVLVLDAGHGGSDSGALGKKAKEKDINLAVTKLVGNKIAREYQDVKVVYTRTKDTYLTLRARTNIANQAGADLFISIHSNASKSSSPTGAEVYILGMGRQKENLDVVRRENNVIFMEENYEENYINKYNHSDPNSPEFFIINGLAQNKFMKQSLHFASMVQNELVATAKRKNRGVKQAGFWVLVGAGMPSILVELDFISNSESEKFLSGKEGQAKMAQSIVNAFSKYKAEFDYMNNQNIYSQNQNIPNQDNDIAPVSTITYKIQIMATSTKLPEKSKEFKGYKTDFYIENGLYKYTYGESSDLNEIAQLRKSVLKDFKDAFIVKFENGMKIPN